MSWACNVVEYHVMLQDRHVMLWSIMSCYRTDM